MLAYGAAALIALSGPGWAAMAASPPNPTSPPTRTPAGECTVASGSWPEYQGDPTHAANGCSTITAANVAQLRPSWFTPTKGAVTDTPAVAFGSVFAGDFFGTFYALDQSTGTPRWTFDTTAPSRCFLDAPLPHADRHSSGFGQIPGSPAATVIAGRPTVFVVAGDSIYSLDASTGSCLWAQDTDPGSPTNALEIESSPVVDTQVPPGDPPEVMVGTDDNSSSGIGVTGLMAFNAETGELIWKYEPERDLTLTPSQFHGSDAFTLSCGDGSTNADCNSTNIPDLAPNSTKYADACGDVWSSPALDAAFADPAGTNAFKGSGAHPPAGWFPKPITKTGTANPVEHPDGLVVFGTGNCGANPNPAAALAHGDYVDNQGIFGLDPVTGTRVWNFVEPYNSYDNNPNEPGDGDDDFGSSAIVASLPASSVPACPADPTIPPAAPAAAVTGVVGRSAPTATVVIEGSKSGYAYGVCGANGNEVWGIQDAEPGQLSNDLVGSVGGNLGSPSMGVSQGKPAVFFTSAIPTPFSNDGIRFPNDGDTNIATCPGPGLSSLPLLPACPDLSILDDPQRLVSLHAVDAATGRIDYQAPSLPTFAASTYTNGVVFLPDSLAAGLAAFNADNGQPLWAFPLLAVPASAAAIAGDSIYLGTGETDSSLQGQSVPPQLTGIWSFSTAGGAPAVP